MSSSVWYSLILCKSHPVGYVDESASVEDAPPPASGNVFRGAVRDALDAGWVSKAGCWFCPECVANGKMDEEVARREQYPLRFD